jgi:deazaflavin-dependent oxidoreductase (nitroreductase family)
VDPAADFCYLTTVGRVTGNPHTIEIWFASIDGRTLYLLSGGGEASDWVRNIRADGAVRVRVGNEEFDARARVVADPEERGRGAQLVYEKYQAGYGGDLTAWRERSTVVAVTVLSDKP